MSVALWGIWRANAARASRIRSEFRPDEAADVHIPWLRRRSYAVLGVIALP